ncbi:MAG: MerR family transcriptional regulator [Candidatus Omnitrophica bacterium]|nr:MerR family transcriptional regulator [Candidatus Omnitrophota bacterium]
MEGPKIPDKLFFSIGEASKIVEIEPHILRYWEKEFKQTRPKRNKKGERNYTKKDIEAILKLKSLLYRDLYTIKGAKQKLRERLPKEGLKKGDLIKFLKGMRKELISLRRTLK